MSPDAFLQSTCDGFEDLIWIEHLVMALELDRAWKQFVEHKLHAGVRSAAIAALRTHGLLDKRNSLPETARESRTHMRLIFDDGGRAAAGLRGHSGDCVTRAIAIATGKQYREVHDALNSLAESERIGRRKKRKSSSRSGVYPGTYHRYLRSLGWRWNATMSLGSGCNVHLRKSELPDGVILARVSRHLVAIIDGEIHDTHDCSRDGMRCVYGYFSPPSN